MSQKVDFMIDLRNRTREAPKVGPKLVDLKNIYEVIDSYAQANHLTFQQTVTMIYDTTFNNRHTAKRLRELGW
jgi:hypothetical protein